MPQMKADTKDLNTIEEPLRTYYVEEKDEHGKATGYFVLDVEKGERYQLRDNDALVRALEHERKFRTENKPKLDQLESYLALGAPDDIKRAIAERDDLKKVDPENRGQTIADQKIAEWTQQTKVERDKSETTIKEQEAEIQRLLIDNAARDVIEKAGGKVDPLLHQVTSVAKIVFNDAGKREVILVDERGEKRWKDPVIQKPFTMADRVEELKARDDFAPLFDGSKATGSGARQSGQRAGTAGPSLAGPKHRNDFTDLKAKADWITENGQDAFVNLPAAPRPAPTGGAQPAAGR